MSAVKVDEWGSNAQRRAMLRQAGWKPAAVVTLLTRTAHWLSPDGCWTLTEERAAKRLMEGGRDRRDLLAMRWESDGWRLISWPNNFWSDTDRHICKDCVRLVREAPHAD